MGEPLLAQMSEQIENFDHLGEHKDLFEHAVKQNMPQGAEPYIMGIINGGLVALLEVGRRLDLNVDSIGEVLKDLNPQSHPKEGADDSVR